MPPPDLRQHVGDIIEKARQKRGWNQAQLGEAAQKFVLGKSRKINKSTISRIENDPYGSDLATVWRLLAALGLNFCDVEHLHANPFANADEHPQKARAPSEPRRVKGTKRAS